MPRQPPPNPITERDIRLPEFKDVDIADLERREDGSVARKDRWERGIREIAGMLGMSRESFEVADVVRKVHERGERATIARILEWATCKRTDANALVNAEEMKNFDLMHGAALAWNVVVEYLADMLTGEEKP